MAEERVPIAMLRETLYQLRSKQYELENMNDFMEELKTHLKKNIEGTDKVLLRGCVTTWVNRIQSFWIKCHKSEDRFRVKYDTWLNENLSVPPCLLPKTDSTPRKRKDFEDLSESRKYARVHELSKSQEEETPLLIRATSSTMSARSETAKAKILKELVASPTRDVKMLRRLKAGEEAEQKRKLSTEEALALLFELDLTEEKYKILRKVLMSIGCDGLSPYDNLREEKRNCRPDEEVDCDDFSAKVTLQGLLEHTAQRIVSLREDVIREDFLKQGCKEIVTRLVFNSGMDGTTDQARYNQKPSPDAGEDYDDHSLFVCCVTPLQLNKSGSNLTPYWVNEKPQSSSLVRPLRMQFVKESEQLVTKEKDDLDEEIKNLQSIKIPFGDGMELIVHFDVHIKAIDGKILCYFTGTSTQCCPFCGANPSIMNLIVDGRVEQPPLVAENLQYGAQPLHSYIQFLRNCLNISYRLKLPEKKRSIKKGSTDEEIKKSTKKKIQDQFIEDLGIHVDFPRPGGSGNSCTGNIARRLFAAHKKFSEITGLDPTFVENLNTILVALNCQLPLDATKFGKLCHETAVIYIRNYDWYFMSPSLHKILMHAEAIVNQSVIPVGFFGEEGGESRNKLYREFRRYHTNKSSRKRTMADLFNRSMDTSDPVMSSLRKSTLIRRKKKLVLPLAVRDLLLPYNDENPRTLFPEGEAPLEDDFLELFDFEIPFDEEVEVETTDV